MNANNEWTNIRPGYPKLVGYPGFFQSVFKPNIIIVIINLIRSSKKAFAVVRSIFCHIL